MALSRMTWRRAIRMVTLPRTWSLRFGCSGRVRSASSCVPSSRLIPAERPRPNSRAMPSAATAENSSTRTTVESGWCWWCAATGQQVLDDRRGDHRREQRSAVGVQAEVHDVPRLHGRRWGQMPGPAAACGRSQGATLARHVQGSHTRRSPRAWSALRASCVSGSAAVCVREDASAGGSLMGRGTPFERLGRELDAATARQVAAAVVVPRRPGWRGRTLAP